MKLPLILVNFKAYEQATGESAVALAKIHEKVAQETGANICIAVSAIDLAKVCEAVSIPVFAQHTDFVGYGGYTGHILPDMVKEIGASGTLLNHAEFQLENETLEKCIDAAKRAGLFVVACANDENRAAKISGFNPDLVAVEPPELIGGELSVSKTEPAIIERSVNLVGAGKVLVGAGIKDGEDVRIALALGASGVLLASGVVKASDPYSVLMDLVSGLN